jgi:hypothetical protein
MATQAPARIEESSDAAETGDGAEGGRALAEAAERYGRT